MANLKDGLRLDAVPAMGLTLVEEFATFLVVILAASLIASEFSGGTIRTMLPRATSRRAFLTAKLAVLLAFTTLLVIVGFIVALGASAVVTGIGGLNATVGSDFVLRSIASTGRTVYVILPFLSLALLLGLWFRSTGMGIGLTLGVYFADSILSSLLAATGGTLNQMRDLLPLVNAQSIMRTNGTVAVGNAAGNTSLPDPWQAAAVLALYTAGFLILAYWHFCSRDITVGQIG
jgi:ABC-2 type transport system permease protein